MSKAESDYMGKVAALGCAICRRRGIDPAIPAEVHHRRTGIGLGRSSHYETIPLCHEHHRGNTGIHGMGRRAWEVRHGVTEMDLVAETAVELWMRQYGAKYGGRP